MTSSESLIDSSNLTEFHKEDFGEYFGYLRHFQFDEPNIFRWCTQALMGKTGNRNAKCQSFSNFNQCIRCSKKCSNESIITHMNPYCKDCENKTREEEYGCDKYPGWNMLLKAHYNLESRLEEQEKLKEFNTKTEFMQNNQITKSVEKVTSWDEAIIFVDKIYKDKRVKDLKRLKETKRRKQIEGIAAIKRLEEFQSKLSYSRITKVLHTIYIYIYIFIYISV
jgi:hypothetical protein